jgi:anaerobic ribonucleoside-triphosphate reductase
METEIKIENVCHDCSKEIEIDGEAINNGVYLAYENGEEKINVFKCNDCYAKSPALTNYQPCEVYSRVVGYIRPVQQWHKGKKQEFEERKEFVAPNDCC